MSELKPCPFCGGEQDLSLVIDSSRRLGQSSIRCLDCNCSIWGNEPENELIAAWNTRADGWVSVPPELRTLVNCCLQEARDKNLVDVLNDTDLSPDYHLEITITVQELRSAALLLKQPKHGGDFQGPPEDKP